MFNMDSVDVLGWLLRITGIESRIEKLWESKHQVGWKDNRQYFTNANAGGTTPATWALMGVNGHYGMRFSVGSSLFVPYHVGHDYALGSKAYWHIHWLCDIALTLGDTVTWRTYYTIARGHHQGDSLTGVRDFIDVTYTADGTEIAGEHIILECSEAQAINLLEPDTLVKTEVELLSASVTGTAEIFGEMADLHYQSTREVTPNKTPNFYE